MQYKSAFAAAIIVFITMLFLGCSNKVKPGVSDVKRPIVTGVTIGEVHSTLVDELYETSAMVKAKNVSIIASKIMGSVTSILVNQGDKVIAGQVLMIIDNSDAIPKMDGAEAGYQEALKALEEAKQNQSLVSITYERYKKLYQDGAIAKQQMDQAETKMRVVNLEIERLQQSVKRAEAGLSEAQAYYGFSQLTAPTSGIVTAKNTDIGSMATPGIPLIVVEDNSAYNLEADIDEKLSGKLSIGMAVNVVIDSIAKEMQGSIIEIAPAIDPAARKFHIKVAVQGDGLKTGQYARIKIVANKKEAIVLPKTAIVEKGQLTGVYAIDKDGVISYRIVRVGKLYGTQVEILSGISLNEKVIINEALQAVDGGIVKEVNPQ